MQSFDEVLSLLSSDNSESELDDESGVADGASKLNTVLQDEADADESSESPSELASRYEMVGWYTCTCRRAVYTTNQSVNFVRIFSAAIHIILLSIARLYTHAYTCIHINSTINFQTFHPILKITTFSVSGSLNSDLRVSLHFATAISCPVPTFSINRNTEECDMHKFITLRRLYTCIDIKYGIG